MLEFPRVSILDVSEFPSRKHFEDFDAKRLEQNPIIFKRGKVRYRLGVVLRAYKGRDEILADIALLGNFKGFVRGPDEKTDNKIEIQSVEFILDRGPKKVKDK